MNKDNFLRFIMTSINRLIACAVAEKNLSYCNENYLLQRVQRVDKQAFQRLLVKVPKREVQLGDEP